MGLGDCWFLSSCAAVAEDANRMTRIMGQKHNHYNKGGIFRFWFYVKSRWYAINVDDRIPSRTWGNGWRPWATWPSDNGAWWMPLLEKAFAKLDQNYDRLAGGNGDEGMRLITGMPVTQFQDSPAKMNKLLPIYEWASSKGFPMTSGCCQGNKRVDGLHTGHAYSLLGIRYLKDSAGNVVHTLAHMRNPWGVENYVGPWSDKSSLWTR